MTITKVSTGLIEADAASVNLNIDENTLYIDVTTNRVGIGNTNPSTALDVTGSVTADGLTTSGNILLDGSGNPTVINKTSGAGNNPVYRLQADTNYWDLQGTFSNTDDELFFMYNGSTKMAITSAGNVGIGVADGDVTGDGTAARTYVAIIGTANRGRLNLGTTASNGADSGVISFVNGANELGAINMDTTPGVQNTGTMYVNSTGALDVRAAGGAVFNENGIDADFRVESVGNENMLFIDASTNEIGMGRTPSSAQLDIEGESSGTITGLRIRNSGQVAGSAIKQIWSLNRSGSSLDFEAASITAGKSQDWTTTPSTVDSYMIFKTIADESPVERMRFDGGGTIFNEGGDNQDFRVESVGNENMLHVAGGSNGVGIRANGDGNQSLKIKSTGATGNMTLIEDEGVGDGSYTPYYQYKVAYIAGNSSNTQLTIPFNGRSYNQTGYLKIRVLPALHNLSTPANVATAEFALTLAYQTTVAVGAVLSSSGNYASATGNASNELIITFTNAYSNASMSGAFVHIEFFGQQGVQGAPDWNNIAFN